MDVHSRWVSILASLSVAFLFGCQNSRAATRNAQPLATQGEVWLTPQQDQGCQH